MTFRTRAAAEQWAREFESQMDRGRVFDISAAKSTTVSDLLNSYLVGVIPRKKSVASQTSAVTALTNGLGHLILLDLTPEAIAKWGNERLEDVSSDTLRKELSILSHAVDLASTWGVSLPENPVKLARKAIRLTPGECRDRRLRPGEFRRLLKVSPPGHRALWIWFVESAMRRGEVAAMKPAHRRGGFLRIPDTKTGKPRTIPITRHMARVWNDLPFGMRPDSITQAFDRACRRAGIEGLRLHDLRHEATSRLFEKGLNIQEVASITGHSNWASLKRYTHLAHESIARKLAASHPANRPYP